MPTRRKIPLEQPAVTQEIGPDGWPIGRDEAAHEEAWRRGHEAWLQHRLGVCQDAVEKDAYGPALMEALQLCIDYKRPLPNWLAQSVWASMSRLFDKPKTRKRFDSMTAQRLKHYERWDAVKYVWENRKDLETRARRLGVNDDLFPLKWDHVFEYAAQYLGGGETAAAVEKSYKQVRAALNRGDGHKWMVAHLRGRKPLKKS